MPEKIYLQCPKRHWFWHQDPNEHRYLPPEACPLCGEPYEAGPDYVAPPEPEQAA